METGMGSRLGPGACGWQRCLGYRGGGWGLQRPLSLVLVPLWPAVLALAWWPLWELSATVWVPAPAPLQHHHHYLLLPAPLHLCP